MKRYKLNIIISILFIATFLSIYGCTSKNSNIDGEEEKEIPVNSQESGLGSDTSEENYEDSSQSEEEIIDVEGGDMLKNKFKGNLKGNLKGIYTGELQGEDVPFEASIIKTGSYTMGKEFPRVGLYKGIEDLGAIDTIGYDSNKYDEEFFKSKALIVIELQEGSGSVRHEVKKVVINGDNITVGINRRAPEIGTADMAEWAIFVEIDKALINDNTVANFTFIR